MPKISVFSTTFTVALTVLTVATSAVAQTTPVANGYQFRFVTNNPYGDFVPTDGFDGFCPISAVGSFSEIDLLVPDGEAFLLANQINSFNSGHGGNPVYFQTTRNDLPRGGHACGLNDVSFFTFGPGSDGGATLWDFRLGDNPSFGNYHKLLEPGQVFTYVGGSATYLDGYTVTANYGRTVLTGSFDRGFGPRTLVFELFAGTPPRLLGDLGNDQALKAVLTANNVYVNTINGDQTSEAVVAVPRNGQPFTIGQLDGITLDDLTAPPYSKKEIVMAANRTMAVLSIRQGQHLLIQTLRDGEITPITVLDTNQIENYPVDRVGSVALTQENDIYFVMTTVVPVAETLGQHGGQESIYRFDPTGQLVRVMTEGVDITRLSATGWSVTANASRVLASRNFGTYEILQPIKLRHSVRNAY